MSDGPPLTGDELVALIMRQGDGLADLAARLASKSAGPEDMAKIAEEAEEANDRSRAASRKWAQGAAGTVGTVGAYLATTGVGAVVGGAVVAAAAIAYGVYEGILALWDLFEEDLDGEEDQQRVEAAIGWYLSRGLPFPEWNRDRHGHLAYYADELEQGASVIEGTNDATLRVGQLFVRGIAANDPYVVVALLVGGEGGRHFVYTGAPSDELTSKMHPAHLVTNRQALELLLLAIGTSVAQSRELPPTHWQAVVDHAKKGWLQGVTDAARAGVYHRGAVAFATAALQAEAMADYWRARLDDIEAASPGAVEAVFGIRHARRAEMSGTMFDRLGVEVAGAKRRAAEVPRSLADEMKPPVPEVVPLTGGEVAIGGGLAVAAGWFVLKTAAGAGIRRILGL